MIFTVFNSKIFQLFSFSAVFFSFDLSFYFFHHKKRCSRRWLLVFLKPVQSADFFNGCMIFSCDIPQLISRFYHIDQDSRHSLDLFHIQRFFFHFVNDKYGFPDDCKKIQAH